MKSEKELNELKENLETLKEKLKGLTPEELEQVTGGGNGATENAPTAIYLASKVVDIKIEDTEAPVE